MQYNLFVISVQENISLAQYSTMKLGGTASHVVHIQSEDQLIEAVEFAKQHMLSVKVIGAGSNIIWSGDYEGLVVVNDIRGFDITNGLVTISAGENWDECVERTVNASLTGIECLSLIPGTAGATPVQNVGAYGVEIADVLVSVRAYEFATNQFVDIPNSNCNFSYRQSRFNTDDIGKFCITSITLQLREGSPVPPFYKALQEYLDEKSINLYTPKNIRDAVIAIRQSKLPDPKIIPNCGSFFKNPIIPKEQFDELKKEFVDMPGWDHEGKIKVPAAWLLDRLGYKDYTDESTGMATYEKHPLVVINKSATSIQDLHTFKHTLIFAVQDAFGIELQQEPELV